MNDFYQVPCIFPTLSRQECRQDNTDGTNAFLPAHQKRPVIQVRVPGSKSITNRAMLLAALSDGTVRLDGALFSDDSRHLIQCLIDLGYNVSFSEEPPSITITGNSKTIPHNSGEVYVGSAGTAARFLAAMLGCSHGAYHMDASTQMRRRPMAPLLHSLTELGAEILFDEQEGFFPFTIVGHGFCSNDLTVNIDQSSQFLSALLISSVCAQNDVCIHTVGSHGMAYIDITTRMMEQFGVPVEKFSSYEKDVTCSNSTSPAKAESTAGYRIREGGHYRAMDYVIEPDVSAASYFYAMAPLLGVDVMVKGVHGDSMQGDLHFLDLLCHLGCTLEEQEEGLLLHGIPDGIYPGIEADMSTCSDQAITMAALAPFASSPTTITGIGHIRHQESDRIHAICTELSRMGIRCDEYADSITIYPGAPAPCEVQTYDDHRMAMGFSLIGLRAPGIRILDPGCCRKTFENYFDCLDHVIDMLK